MVSLARSTLLHEWRRFLAAVLATAFSAVLMQVQFALLLGMFATVTTVVDRSEAELWLTSPDLPSVELGREIPRRLEAVARGYSSVARAEPLLLGLGEWRSPGGQKVAITLVGYEARPDGLGLPAELREFAPRLGESAAVLLEETDLAKLGVTVGESAEVNGRKVRVVGTVRGFRAIGGANVLASAETFRHLTPSSSEDRTSFVLLDLRDGESAEAVRDRFRREMRGVSVWTGAELSQRSQRYWLLESGAGAGAGFASLLGLAVGVAITSQTLRAAMLASLREFATLRALGVPSRRLARVVLEQSFWIGLLGLLLAAVGTASVAALGAWAGVAMLFPGWLLALTAAFSLGVALLSGALALRPLYSVEPADLLR